MYDVTSGTPDGYRLRSGDPGVMTFRPTEVTLLINTLLTRKERNNGIGRHLLRWLSQDGFCRHDAPKGKHTTGFYCARVQEGRYSVHFFGEKTSEWLERLNAPSAQKNALQASRLTRRERRRLRALGEWQDSPKVRLPRPLAGANGGLKHHFKNTKVTFEQVVSAIARATRLRLEWVQRRLFESLDHRGVVTLRLRGGFVFRIDTVDEFRGILDFNTLVQIRTTKDNRHAAYRRLRRYLKRGLDLESRHKKLRSNRFMTVDRLAA